MSKEETKELSKEEYLELSDMQNRMNEMNQLILNVTFQLRQMSKQKDMLENQLESVHESVELAQEQLNLKFQELMMKKGISPGTRVRIAEQEPHIITVEPT